MCGIVGYCNFEKPQYFLDKLYQATQLISHRGPDDEGYAFFNLQNNTSVALTGADSPESLKKNTPMIESNSSFEHHLAFGFRRFSIVDLTEKGHQPFWNRDKTICLIFNGEIYNYIEIRNELEKLGYSFSTTCDTEVLLVGYQAWGMDVLKYCNGPVAMVLYDSRKRKLYMARDRLGKSPLYYAVSQGTLYWASEIKAILSMTGHSCFEIHEQVVYDYLNYGWRDLDNTTFWKGIYTLKAAHWAGLDISKKTEYSDLSEKAVAYWNFPQKRPGGYSIAFSDACDQFRTLFHDAVRIRAHADAKVAFSLSGGLDSSSIVATAANILPSTFRTYSLKFPGLIEDEEFLAQQVYERYSDKIDYQTYTPKNDDFWLAANDFIWLQEEPFHFPNAQLFQAYFREARKENYKVMIIGAGGDELLAGYHDYYFPLLMQLKNSNRILPLMGNLFLNRQLWPKYCIRKRLKIFNALFRNREEYFKRYYSVSFFNQSGQEFAVPYLKEKLITAYTRHTKQMVPQDFHSMAVGYMSNWLMNYWQRNGNKSHFGVPMETRSPFLDYRLVDLVFTLPPEYIVHNGWTKYLLRKVINRQLPKSVIWNRRKQGLPFNTVSWFAHAKPIIEKQLKSVYNNPYVDTNSIMEHYDDLLRRQPMALWRAVNFCLWWKRVILKESL
jgi:asparagine synthase (glutamine-hydrolysing)